MQFQRKWWMAFLALVVLLVGSVASAGMPAFMGLPTVRVLLDGAEVKGDVPAVILEGRTLLPVRAVAEALGLQVQWDAQTQTAILSKVASSEPAVSRKPAEQPAEPKALGRITTPDGVVLTVRNIGMVTALDPATNEPTVAVEIDATVRNGSKEAYDLNQARFSLLDASGKMELEGKVEAQDAARRAALAPGAETTVRLVFTHTGTDVPTNLKLVMVGTPGGPSQELGITITIECSWPPFRCRITISF